MKKILKLSFALVMALSLTTAYSSVYYYKCKEDDHVQNIFVPTTPLHSLESKLLN